MKKIILFLILLHLFIPLVLSDGYGTGNYGQNLYSSTDLDSDGVPDSADTLLYNETNVNTTGITSLNITVGGNSTQTSPEGENEVLFFDNSNLIVNFSHNFTSSSLDLSKVKIKKASTYLITNFSGQLTENKTLYFTDAGFNALCVKDAEIDSVSEISSSCDGTNETDFTNCLGNSTGITINGITCTDSGSAITIRNLRNSGVRGTIPESASPTHSSGGGGGGSSTTTTSNETTCSTNSDCKSGEYCFGGTCKVAECTDDSTCGPSETCWNLKCTKLFDVEIIDFESPFKLGNFFNFTYLIYGRANINRDVKVNFWIEKDGEKVASGKDVIYIGSYESKTKTSKIFLPEDSKEGDYVFHVQVNFNDYIVESHRTIGIDINKDGEVTLKKIPKGILKVIDPYVAVGVLFLLIAFLFWKFVLKREGHKPLKKRKKKKPKKKMKIKRKK